MYKNKKLSIIASLVLVASSFIGLVRFQSVSADPHHDDENKVMICHLDGHSGKYSSTNVDENSVYKHDGHGYHNGDIVPAFGSHSAVNMFGKQLAIYENDCKDVKTPKLVAATFTPATCDTLGTYTIPKVDGVQYYVNGAAKSHGTYTAATGSTITITVGAKKGYYIPSVPAPQVYTFAAPVCVETVIPVAVEFTDPENCDEDGSYAIPSVDGVSYYVNGELTDSGTYSAKNGESVSIIAVADEGYVLGDATSAWDHTFTAPEECGEVLGAEDVTPVAVIFTASTCDAIGYYTIPAVAGVKYSVDGVVKAAGKYTVANGNSVIVIASPISEDFTLKTGSVNTWTYDFKALTGCVLGASTTATTLPVTSGESTTGNLIVLSTVAGLITAIGFAFRSVFARKF